MNPSVPSTLLEFQSRFPDEASCERYLFEWRWPGGFRCPRCGGEGAWALRGRALYQCKCCRHQASVTAGTALHRSKLPLRVWFWAIFLVGRHKKSISALQLQSDLGLGSYRTAWLLLHKIRACFDESGDFPLRGNVEVDETLVGACGKGDPPGKDPGHKSIVVAAVETRTKGLGSLRMKQVPDYTSDSLVGFVRECVELGSHVHTDGWAAYDRLSREGYTRTETVSTRQPRGAGHILGIPGVHTVMGNLKTWLTGRFHGVSPKYLSQYLAEFTYRFNRRRSPSALFGWVVRRLVQRSPLTLGALRAADAGA